MKKHFLRFFSYYLVLNLLIFVFAFSNIIAKGIISSENEIYKCPEVGVFVDLGPHFKDCNFKTFLTETFLVLGMDFVFAIPFMQPIIIISILISYYILKYIIKNFKKIDKINYFFKSLIFIFLNFTILFPIFYLFLKNN